MKIYIAGKVRGLKNYREVFKADITYAYAPNAKQNDAPIGKKVSYPNLDILIPKVNE